MIRGIYTGASAMSAEATRTDVISNNLANANTVGFKKDLTITKDFASVLITRINDGPDAPTIGSVGTGVTVDEISTSQTAGMMKNTGNDFDLAIEVNGFFAVQTPRGVRYTRNGTFSKNLKGELITEDGYPVLGQNGAPITIKGNKMVVGPDGNVIVDSKSIGKLQIVEFADNRRMAKEGASLFIAPAGQNPRPVKTGVRQGYLEMANVNIVSEMVNLITNYRAYELNSKVVQSHDQLIGKAVNDVGKL